MLDQGRKRRVRSMPSSILPGDRNARLCELAAEAREKLRPWALQPSGATSTFDPLYEPCGGQEGVGGLLRIAALDPTGSGQLTDAEADKFLAESSQLFEDIIHALNLSALVAALAFTVAVPLAVLNLDGLSTFDTADASLGGARSPTWYQRWHGARLLHASHWTGNILLALSIYCSFNAISTCFMLMPTYSIYLPDVESRLRYFMHHYSYVTYVWPYTYFSVGLLLLSLPFLAARISPVASMCAGIPAVSAVSVFKYTCVAQGDAIANFQLELAKRLLATEDLPRGGVVS